MVPRERVVINQKTEPQSKECRAHPGADGIPRTSCGATVSVRNPFRANKNDAKSGVAPGRGFKEALGKPANPAPRRAAAATSTLLYVIALYFIL